MFEKTIRKIFAKDIERIIEKIEFNIKEHARKEILDAVNRKLSLRESALQMYFENFFDEKNKELINKRISQEDFIDQIVDKINRKQLK